MDDLEHYMNATSRLRRALGFYANKKKMAEIQHDIWSHWMRFMFSCGTFDENGDWVMPKQKAERWQRQMNTKYQDLSEKEQQSDVDVIEEFHITDVANDALG